MAKCTKHRMPDGTIMDGPTHGADQECIEWDTTIKEKGGRVKNPLYKGNGKKTAKHFSAGGYLVGPSHAEGGISAIVDGTEPIEVEGGEFVINKQTVDAVGEDFLHKLNSTQTSHHTGGFGQGQLPQPSKYKDGGKINEGRRTTMSKGKRKIGRMPTKRMAMGGRVEAKRRMATGRKFGSGGRMCGGPGQKPCGSYRTGGTINRTRPVRSNNRLTHGGSIHYKGSQHYGAGNSACRAITSETSCKNSPGCIWDASGPSCR